MKYFLLAQFWVSWEVHIVGFKLKKEVIILKIQVKSIQG